eukprot:496766_1
MDEIKVNHERWKCNQCTVNNNAYLSYCEVCFSPKGDEQNTVKPNKRNDSQQINTRSGWQCEVCTNINNKYIPYCESCYSPKNSAQNTTKPDHDDEDSKQTATKSSWKCKVCTSDNNQYIPYCETCLVSKNVQMNDKLLSQLKSKLNSFDCDKHIKADDIKNIIVKLKDDFQRLKKYQTDKKIVPEIQKQIEQLYGKMNIKCDANIVQDFIDTYNIDKHAFTKHKAANKKCHPVCKCGTEMISKKATKCYGTEYPYVICDICDKRIKENAQLFHCPRKKVQKKHPHGFDICLPCRKQYIHRLRKFVAIIICPKMAENHVGKDADMLYSMFKKLGFHEIICLKDDTVNKYSVEYALNKMLPKGGDENVNQFTVICYSGHGEMKDGIYHFAIDPRKKSTWISSEIIRTQCRAARYGAVLDGMGRYFDQFWHRTYYRHNTLLLVNSCHSAGSYNFVNSQTIADSFGTFSALTVLLAPFGITPIMLVQAAKKLGKHLGKTACSCVKECLQGEMKMECITKCFGITGEQIILIAKMAGVAVIVVIIVAVSIYKSIGKSKECESIYVIASCHKQEESNSCYGVSPFIKYCNDFFDIFLNPQMNKIMPNGHVLNAQYLSDSPAKLLDYLKVCYGIKDKSLGGVCLNEIGQTVCASKRGFHQFAMCPMLNQN